MTKVLQIGMSYEVGGIEIFVMNHYKQMNPSEIQFDFINIHDKMAMEKEIESLGGKIYTVTNSKKNPFLSFQEIKNIIDQNGYDVVHIHVASLSNIVPLLAAKESSCPHIILHSHNNGLTGNLFKRVLHSVNCELVSHMELERLACSKSAGEWMFKNAQFEVFENAIPAEHFQFDEKQRQEIRDQFGISQDSFVIGNVGRLHPQKNQAFLIEVFKEYLNLYSDSYLMIVGEGSLKDQLMNLVYALNLQSRVIFTGFKSNVLPYYQAMDTFCLPSIYEGLGIVGIEAQMSGLPCIFSEHCVEEVNISGNSFFLPVDKEDEWLRALEMCRKVKDNWNRCESPQKYDIRNSAKKLGEIYSRNNY